MMALTEQVLSGETFLALSDDSVLVKSQSTEGEWHTLTLWNGKVCSCSCKGFSYRGSCRHVKAFEVSRRELCEACGHPTNGRFAGHTICAMCALNAD